jgi:hypothetical protein
MTAYVPTSITRAAGVDLTAAGVAVAASGDTFPAGSDVFLRVKNAGGTACTVSVINAGANAGPNGTFLAPLNLAPAVPITTGDRIYGPFPASTFADPSDGQVHVAFSFTTSVTALVYRVASN